MERLDRGANGKLTLISAPAGFGKTTMVAAWLATRAARNRTVAWLTLDKTDNDAMPFWAHVVAALQAAVAGEGLPILRDLDPAKQPLDHVPAAIVNELTTLPSTLDLVLDDYHLIDQPDIQTGMEFLLEHLPPNVHVIISTRSDPALPVARLRARGELTEIRSADLRFTTDETAIYFNVSLGLGLPTKELAALEDKTEGWIAALQLAALSMQGRNDLTAFVADFTGDDRYVFDYLVEEVLERQSDDVRHFLLQTCFLARLSGPLCDAVTGGSGGKKMLDALYQANLFVVPLDDRRRWYRYHHLFADVLLTQLGEDARHELPALHRRASDWYERQGERFDAIEHALAGECFERAAELIELAIPLTQRNRGEAIIRRWVRALPSELVRYRPVLGIGYVGALATLGELDEVEDRLREIEHCLAAMADTSSPSSWFQRVVVVDKDQLARLPGAIEMYRAALAQARGDVPGTIRHAQCVLDLATPHDHLSRASASSLLGIGYWSEGHLEKARQAWTQGRDGLRRIGHIPDTLGISIALADINLALGHLREAIDVFEYALKLAANEEGKVVRGTADMHAGLAELHRERNEVTTARQHLAASQELGESAGLPQHPYRLRVVMAHLKQDEGDYEPAVALLDEADRLYTSDFFPNFRPVAAMRARVWIAQGRLDEALRWQNEAGIDTEDDLSYLREFEHITLARLLLAEQGFGEPVLRFLDRLWQAAEHGGRNGSVIEISILQALARRPSDIEGALVHLERAIVLAAPEQYVRIFVNERQPMESLLQLAIKRRIAPIFTPKLLRAFAPHEKRSLVYPDLLEPLSKRELDVLRLLATDLGGPEIARELGVSPNTMRTHTKNIYDKLGVNSRRSAVRRGMELGLLARSKIH